MAVEQFDGKIEVRTTDGSSVVLTLNGDSGNITAGTELRDGDLVLRAATEPDSTGRRRPVDRVHIDAAASNLYIGGNDRAGDILLQPAGSTNLHDTHRATFYLEGEGGKLHMRDSAGNDRVMLSAHTGNLLLGGNGADGDIVLFPASVNGGDRVAENASIHMDGDKGDIVLRNADCAEEFEIDATAGLIPGTVVAIGSDGRLESCSVPYDKRVVGIIAGAGDLRPGIVLGREPGKNNRLPLALIGRVNCFVEADDCAIETGDLLTSSATPGHAMKANDRERAFGAVIGKALAPMPSGRGMIPVLVALQ